MAERVGFEPTEPVKAQQFSRLPDSTTLAPLREANYNSNAQREKISSGDAILRIFNSFRTKKILHQCAAFVR